MGVFLASMSVHYMRAVPAKARKGHQFPRPELQRVVSGQMLGTNLGTLEEQVVLLIVQPALQLPYFNILVLCLGRLWRK